MDTMALMLLRIIQNNPRALSLKDLVPITGMTEKKLRASLLDVRNFVENEGGELVVSQGVYHLEPTTTDFVSKVYSLSFYDYKLSRYERIMVEFFLCLLSNPIITIGEVSDLLFVSRSTVNADLKELEELLEQHDSKLIGLTGNGICIEGPLEELDRVVYQFIKNNPYLFEMILAQPGLDDSFNELRAFNRSTKEKIRETEASLNHFLGEKESQNLNSFLTYRFGYLPQNYVASESIQKTPFIISLLKNVAIESDQLESDLLNQFDVELRSPHAMFDSTTDDIIIQFLVMTFIENVSNRVGLPLNNDFDFYQNLSRHIQSVYINKTVLPENVAALMLIKDEYPEIMSIVEVEVPVFERLFKRQLTDVEKSLILIYVCTSVEKFYHACQRLNILIVCNAGVGIGRLIQAKLEARFRFNVVGCVAKKQLSTVPSDKYDFIISTVPLKNYPYYVLVSYLLTDEDIALINQMMSKTYLAQHLALAGGRRLPILRDEAAETTTINQLINEQRVQLDIDARTWEEAVSVAALPLLREGVIEQSYIDAMIDNIQENGMYMMIGKQTILPHAALHRGSLKLGISFARLKEAITVNQVTIKYIFVLSPIDKMSHLDVLFHLGRLAKSKDFLDGLSKATNEQEIIHLLEERSE